MNKPLDSWIDRRILALRPAKNAVDTTRPYAWLVEPERTRTGSVEDTAAVFLTNRECPFRCLMCDLWKNTTDERVSVGAIPGQIEYALAQMKPARHIKLYNSGNFFDAQAIPPEDWPRITQLLTSFETVIVESHPRLIGTSSVRLRDMLRGEVQVAMGLETAHPEVLARLNKRMTLVDFETAVQFLTGQGIPVRAFILLRPPFLSEEEGVQWAKESLRFAFRVGVECCVIIPTRGGNGAMEQLEREGHFSAPCLQSLEEVLSYGVGLGQGRVFADLWDAERLCRCPRCGPERIRRLQTMNLTQQSPPLVDCSCTGRP